MIGDDVAGRLLAELAPLLGDPWPPVRREVAAKVAAGLLAELGRSPLAPPRLLLEREVRADELSHREVA
jgi:hypothetical protein